MNDNLTLKGKLQLILTDSEGRVKLMVERDNLIVTVGKNFAANALLNASASPFSHMAIGTGTTPAALANTTLETETVRQAFTSSSVPANVANMSATYAAGVGTGAITEAGLFNAGVAGTMLSRVVFDVINKGASDALTINWAVTVG